MADKEKSFKQRITEFVDSANNKIKKTKRTVERNILEAAAQIDKDYQEGKISEAARNARVNALGAADAAVNIFAPEDMGEAGLMAAAPGLGKVAGKAAGKVASKVAERFAKKPKPDMTHAWVSPTKERLKAAIEEADEAGKKFIKNADTALDKRQEEVFSALLKAEKNNLDKLVKYDRELNAYYNSIKSPKKSQVEISAISKLRNLVNESKGNISEVAPEFRQWLRHQLKRPPPPKVERRVPQKGQTLKQIDDETAIGNENITLKE